MSRQNWNELPATVRAAVRARTGPLRGVELVDSGFSSQFAATLETEDGRVFVKGVLQSGSLSWTHQREADINPYVVPLGPRLLWRVTVDGWDLLGFEYLDGRGADYSPGSADLPLVVEVMTEAGRLTAADVEIADAAERWADCLDGPADAALLSGDTLLHTDWFHTNVFITGPDSARLIDWAWPTRGAAWIDPACWTVWLIFAGHSPHEAEQWAGKVPAWSAADPGALDLGATVLARYWQHTADEHSNDWTHRLRAAAARWAAHRNEV
ncbi:aminoglycoside phosphotransferase [Streptomyces sioyaensis]|uniref:aminoglycoside phosphotransferase n=1 Tax=Streptomyces sioyaensis TaxID=67364 RepID=UPI003792C007